MPTRTQANSYLIPTRTYCQLVPSTKPSRIQYQLVPKLTVLSYCWLLLCNVSYKQEHVTCLPFDYDSFASELRQSELVLFPPSDVTHYDETLTTLLDMFVPLQKVRSKARPSAPWFDADCRCSKAKTRKLEKAYHKKPSNESRLAWRAQFADQLALFQTKLWHFAPWFFNRLWRYISSVLTYLLTIGRLLLTPIMATPGHCGWSCRTWCSHALTFSIVWLLLIFFTILCDEN